MIRDATRTMAAVFMASGIARAHAHRFRHTLDYRRGCNSPNIIRKHYAKWTMLRQRVSKLMRATFSGTPEVHKKTMVVNS